MVDKVTTPALVMVHGFNVEDPSLTVGKLSAELRKRGWIVEEFHYGHASLIDVRFANGNLSEALLSYLLLAKKKYGSVVPIGHSNGCALIKQAGDIQKDEAVFTRSVYVSPALNKKTTLAPAVSRCDVFHNKGDRVVTVGSFIPFHIWGDMGRHGYAGEDARYVNHDCTGRVSGHSDWFNHVGWFSGKIEEVVNA